MPAESPMAGIESRLKWRALPTVLFLGILVALAVVGVVSALVEPVQVAGLPDAPEVHAVRDSLVGKLAVRSGELRFRSAFVSGASGIRPLSPGETEVALRAEEGLRSSPGWNRDARVLAFLSHLDLARRRFGQADHGYRRAIDLSHHCPEAHLGLGISLALQSAVESDPFVARGLRLQAIAQFAAIRPGDFGHEEALFNRAAMLARVGRPSDARSRAREFTSRYPRSPVGARLSRLVD